ncbi:MAG: P-II family nitrogen regulator [Bellilinea sp.]
MYMILFVLHNPELLDQVLNAWEEAGVGGVTILPSTGLARIRAKGAWRDDLPLFPSLEDFQEHLQNLNRTLITIVENDAVVDKVVAATQQVTGDLNLPNTGILSVLPVVRSYGLNRIPEVNRS